MAAALFHLLLQPHFSILPLKLFVLHPPEIPPAEFGNAARRGSNDASARCKGAVGGASGSAEDGEEILGVAHDDDG